MPEFGPDMCLTERCLNDHQMRLNCSRQTVSVIVTLIVFKSSSVP